MHGATASFGGSSLLAFFDFTTLTPGGVSLSAYSLSFSRTDAANNATVQTSGSALVTGITANTPRCQDNGVARGFLLEETRQNDVINCRDMTATGWTAGSLVTTTGPSGLGAVTAADNTTGSCSQADVTSGGFSKYRSFSSGAGNTRTVSSWVRNVTGSTSYQLNFFGAADHAKTGTLGTAWQRNTFTQAPTTSGFVPCDCRNLSGAPGGTTATARNEYVDFNQNELGKFATSVMISGASAFVRAGERLYDASGSRLVDNGRLTMVASFRPLGASTEYASNMWVWQKDSNNHAEFDASTGALKITIGGTLYTTAGTISWAAFDLVEIFLAAGGGTTATVVKYRVNGGSATTLSTGSPPTQASISSVSTLDLFCNGTANQLSAVFLSMGFYRAGGKPSWA